jgi:hypothetical protein
VINNPEASFEGIVISDKDNANVETTPNTERNATDYTVNAKTAYVQMLDGSWVTASPARKSPIFHGRPWKSRVLQIKEALKGSTFAITIPRNLSP